MKVTSYYFIEKLLCRIKSKLSSLFEKDIKHSKYNRFYRPNKTCQIKNLHWLFEKHFGRLERGVFVEVGAFDGEYASNTDFLADLGWNCYYIEPIPRYREKCAQRHKGNIRSSVHELAIGSKKDNVLINVSGPLSSINKKSVEVFKSLNWAKKIISEEYISVPQTTLNNFFIDNKIRQNFELLVIDVEGYELEVLKGFNIKKYKPKMVIIELHDQNLDYKDEWETQEKITLWFEDNDYKIVYKDFTNTVYVSPWSD